MPLAVTHVLSTIIFVDLYRDYVAKHKKYFTLHTVFIAGIAGLLPDIDLVIRTIGSIFNLNLHWFFQHGNITHTPFFALFFLIPALFLLYKDKKKEAMYFFVIVFGILLHIFLDYLIGGGAYEGIMWLFPFSLQTWRIHLLSCTGISDLPMAIDAVILLAWLYHEEIKHKISDFI
ncbi:metal-dependent hydrolase [Candidatus Woesearchaeota archaeon]|nr:metal-dependent hydrolase [Candidatus Woesearchaeota archaeon]